MANPEPMQVSSLPLPPTQYINLYTDDNVRRNRVPKPPLMTADTYKMFGNIFHNDDNVIRPLESQGIKRLYPQHCDRRKELKKMNHSLLANFLDLLDVLIRHPDNGRRAEKIDDLSSLFIHIHHLLNEFRPHQARETLRVMMELQKRQRLETAQRFQRHLDNVRESVNNSFNDLATPSAEQTVLPVELEMLKKKRENESFDRKSKCHPLDRIMCEIIDNEHP